MSRLCGILMLLLFLCSSVTLAEAEKPKRSASARKQFLKSQGYTRTPEGFQVDHIVPLCAGGADSPENMQLITIEAHKAKTKIDTRICRGKK